MSGYTTIEGAAEAEVTEKKSRFIAHLEHVDTEEAALAVLATRRQEHAQARHNVYAYLLQSGRARYSDDGEPAQTSGLPTYEVLERAGLTDIICVTTRYFGGTLLGTGGLVRAYTQAVQEAIKAAHIVVISRCRDISLRVPYPLYDQVVKAAQDAGAAVQLCEYAADVSLTFRIKDGEEGPLIERFRELTRGESSIAVTDPFSAAL